MTDKPLRSFAWLKANQPERFKQICSAAGKKSHRLGAHEFSAESASRASLMRKNIKRIENAK
jgi:hypothetical protein